MKFVRLEFGIEWIVYNLYFFAFFSDSADSVIHLVSGLKQFVTIIGADN